MLFKDGSLLGFLKNIVEDPFCKDVVVRSEESESSKLKSTCCSTREVHPSNGLFNTSAIFNSYVEMPLVGFGKEIIFLLRKMNVRRGNGVFFGRL